MNKQKTYSFEAISSGDGECFCWKVDEQTLCHFCDIDEVHMQKELGLQEEIWENDLQFRLYPGSIFKSSNNKKQKITITIEEIE